MIQLICSEENESQDDNEMLFYTYQIRKRN